MSEVEYMLVYSCPRDLNGTSMKWRRMRGNLVSPPPPPPEGVSISHSCKSTYQCILKEVFPNNYLRIHSTWGPQNQACNYTVHCPVGGGERNNSDYPNGVQGNLTMMSHCAPSSYSS